MKYIKTFEEKVNGRYWRINCKSPQYISLSLKKIGLIPDDQIYNDIMNDENFIPKIAIMRSVHRWHPGKIDYFYICNGISDIGEEYWYYSVSLNQFKNVYKYMGQVKIEDFELSADKFNL